jgi:hypothetical protein
MKVLYVLLSAFIFFAFKTFDVPVQPHAAISASEVKKASSPSGSSCTSPINNVEKVVCLADAFKATLSSTQVASLETSLTSTAMVRWSNLPCGLTCRNGLLYSSLSATQLAAAKAVIAAASGTTADDGYSEFSQVNSADDVLAVTAGSGYSSGNYIIAFLGTPSTTGKWMLQFGGHHYAQNVTFNAGKVTGTTPSHQGIEPKTWTSGTTTYAPLKIEQSAMAEMLASLSTTQLAAAKLSTTFSDVSLGPGKDGQFPATKVGIAGSTLTTAQKALVLAAIKPWVQDTDDATSASLLAIYQKELDNTYIAYSGNATLANNADYVRIDGPSVWIEFVCQSGVVYRNEIHYHTIFRDHTRDYGASNIAITANEPNTTLPETSFQLETNYPNPFNGSTTIPFTLQTASDVKVNVFDMLGREVATLADGQMGAGKQNVVFNRNANGLRLPTGTYIYRVTVQNAQGTLTKASLLIAQ